MLWMDTDAEYAKKGKIRLLKGKMKAKMPNSRLKASIIII